MPKANSKLIKRPVKRLQAGPKQSDSHKIQRLGTGVALGKFVERIPMKILR